MREMLRDNAVLLLVGVTSFIVMGAGQSLYGPMLPALNRVYGVEISLAAMVVTAHWVGSAAGVGVMFLWPSAVGPRHLLAAMLLGAAALALAPSFATVLLGGFLFGMGYGAATVVFNSRVLQAFGARGPAMVSLMNATFGIGAIAAPLVFVALSSRIQPTFLICAGLTALIWLAAGRIAPPALAPRAEAETAEASTAFRPHWPILVFHGMAVAIEACLIGLGPSALIRAGLPEVEAAQLLSVFFIGVLLSRLAMTFAAHRLDAFATVRGALLLCGLAAVYAAMVAPGQGFAAMGLCAGLFFPMMYVTASGTMGGHPRAAVTIIAAGMLGGIIAPLALSPLLPYLGGFGFFWVIAGLALGLAGLAMVARPMLLGPALARGPAA